MCERCLLLEDELHRLREAASRDIQNVQNLLLAQVRKTSRLETELSEQKGADPKNDEVREVLTYWKTQLDHPKAKTPLDGKRADKVRKALKSYSVAQLKLAIDGCAKYPYVGPHGRVRTKAPGTNRHDDIELILRDEVYIERFQRYAGPDELGMAA